MKDATKVSRCPSICPTTWQHTRKRNPRNTAALFLDANFNTDNSGYYVIMKKLIKISINIIVSSKDAQKSTIPVQIWKFTWESIWVWGLFSVRTAESSTYLNGTWPSTRKKDAISWKGWRILSQFFKLTTAWIKNRTLKLKTLSIQRMAQMILLFKMLKIKAENNRKLSLHSQ